MFYISLTLNEIKFMDEDKYKFSRAFNDLAVAVNHDCIEPSQVKQIKKNIGYSYSRIAHIAYDRSFMNWGLWDKNLFTEFSKLGFDFSRISGGQDIYSILLQYFLVRPIIQKAYFQKRILDVGCGNGIGLKVSSELLRAKESVGADLAWWSVANANKNFYQKNQIHYIQSDAEDLALADGCFDVVTNIESSHSYPQLENFYHEVARVLAPGGYFCYADVESVKQQQIRRFEAFIKSRDDLRIIQKIDITKVIQGSIYNRLIVNEELFYNNSKLIFGETAEVLFTEMTALALGMGVAFLPWWKIKFKQPMLRVFAKYVRKNKYWGKKLYFYYLVQKV